jgi:subtilisin family serine protease
MQFLLSDAIPTTGLVDDVHGYDFAGACRKDYPTGGCGPKPDPQDTFTHGTHVAGIVAAVRNNGFGTSGIAPNVKVMCLKVRAICRRVIV